MGLSIIIPPVNEYNLDDDNYINDIQQIQTMPTRDQIEPEVYDYLNNIFNIDEYNNTDKKNQPVLFQKFYKCLTNNIFETMRIFNLNNISESNASNNIYSIFNELCNYYNNNSLQDYIITTHKRPCLAIHNLYIKDPFFIDLVSSTARKGDLSGSELVGLKWNKCIMNTFKSIYNLKTNKLQIVKNNHVMFNSVVKLYNYEFRNSITALYIKEILFQKITKILIGKYSNDNELRCMVKIPKIISYGLMSKDTLQNNSYHTTTINEIIKYNSVFFILMERAQGITLSEFIVNPQKIYTEWDTHDNDTQEKIMININSFFCKVIICMNNLNIVHNDLNNDNIFISFDSKTKNTIFTIIDFGEASTIQNQDQNRYETTLFHNYTTICNISSQNLHPKEVQTIDKIKGVITPISRDSTTYNGFGGNNRKTIKNKKINKHNKTKRKRL